MNVFSSFCLYVLGGVLIKSTYFTFYVVSAICWQIDKYNHIINDDRRIIINSSLINTFRKGPQYRKNKLVDLDKAKFCILSGCEDWIDYFYSNNLAFPNPSLLSGLIRLIKKLVIGLVFWTTLHKYKHEEFFNSPDTKKDLKSGLQWCQLQKLQVTKHLFVSKFMHQW